MNKFYDQYKGLFVDESKTPYIKQSLANYNTSIPTLSSPYTINKTRTVNQNDNHTQRYSHNNNQNNNYTQNSNNNSNQNELRTLFNKYADKQFNVSYIAGGKKPLQSSASKEFSNVILPKLKMYDREIDNKLKRFKTQHQEPSLLGHNYSAVYQNKQSYLQNLNHSSIYNRNQSQQQHSRYKRQYKFKTPSNNIFHKEFQTYAKMHNNSKLIQQPLYNYTKQQPKKPYVDSILYTNKKTYVDSILYPKRSQNHFNKEPYNHSKEESVFEKQVNRSRIKRKSPIFYMKNNPQDDLETEYQRSYSNKKLPSHNEDQDKQLMSSRVIQKNQILPTNFHQIHLKQKVNQQKTHKKPQNKLDAINTQTDNKESSLHKNHQILQSHKLDSIKQTPVKVKNKHHIMTEPSSPQQPSNVKYYESLRQSLKASRKATKKRQQTQEQSVISEKCEGMKFSQYENQFAFVNRRLQDIYNFNNFYTHKYINSYKLAIMNRLEAKKKVEERRKILRHMLEKKALEQDEQNESAQ